MGKPLREARAEVRGIASRVESFIARAGEACADEVGVEGVQERAIVPREVRRLLLLSPTHPHTHTHRHPTPSYPNP